MWKPSRPAPITHFVEWDAPGRRLVRAICGTWTSRLDHAMCPTCRDCQRELEARETRRF